MRMWRRERGRENGSGEEELSTGKKKETVSEIGLFFMSTEDGKV